MVKILDNTLRDGSYVVDFKFTAKDTEIIAAKLDEAAIPYIEVGHGLGLHAGTRADMKSADPDEAHLEAAKGVVKKGKWGMFFIPGFGRLEDIDTAAKYGMDFIRIGTNVTEVASSEPYIRRAKELGMYVFANYMKTYVMSADKVGETAALSASYGSDVVCVVDSAGGMLTNEVSDYFKAIRKHSDVRIGFHGHNNLGLAIANTLKAIELGADVVDTSVRGLGRSAGNTNTEMLLMVLMRMGIDLNIDVMKLFDLAEEHIDPILKNYQQVDSIGIISGYSSFHSSFQNKVMKYAAKYNVDPRLLIIKLTEHDKIHAPDELVESLAKSLIGVKGFQKVKTS
jgi:4-hydroxy 2-oxovalerate aldolase